MNDRELRNVIEERIKSRKGSIYEFAYKEILASENVEDFIQDILEHWCSSGIVGGLVYYKDTHEFYDKYYDEIEEFRVEFEELNWSLKIDGDLKNSMAWFWFETVILKIGACLGLDV